MTKDVEIAANLLSVKKRIAEAARGAGKSPEDIILVAACKTKSADVISGAIAEGIEICGENRVQEMLEKNAQGAYLGAQLHFIGHLQKNKVKQVVGVCDLIQSVDSRELLSLINDRARFLDIRQEVLLEVNIAGESSKSGIAPEHLPQILDDVADFSCIYIRGLMAIPPISFEKGSNRLYFSEMHKLFIDNSTKKYDNVSMDFLSMGMSGDFEDAIAEGANVVRVGSAIFGKRDYIDQANRKHQRKE